MAFAKKVRVQGIFSLKLLTEKLRKLNLQTHTDFRDVKKDFDKVKKIYNFKFFQMMWHRTN